MLRFLLLLPVVAGTLPQALAEASAQPGSERSAGLLSSH
jgi:hypothetical protein